MALDETHPAAARWPDPGRPGAGVQAVGERTGRRPGGGGKKPVIEAGRIIAHLCRTYGWTPDYCLDRLSWAQVIMFDAYSRDLPGVTEAETRVSPPSEGGDEPDGARKSGV